MIPVYTRNQSLVRTLPLHIGSIGRFNAFANSSAFMASGSFTSGSWPANNRAIYVPMCIPGRFTVARFFVANGAATSGNLDIGLYNAAGSRLISTGTTAQAAAINAVQYIDVPDQSFPAGNYYLALVLSTTSGRTLNSAAGLAQITEISGITFENLGSTVLPTTMTPSARVVSVFPGFGFTQSDTL